MLVARALPSFIVHPGMINAILLMSEPSCLEWALPLWYGFGDRRTSCRKQLKKPLLVHSEDINLQGARGILVNIFCR